MKTICKFILYRVLRWRFDGHIPRDVSRLLVLFMPHTSNWDFVIGMLFIKAENLKITSFGKSELYFFPISLGYKYCNVVPIDRKGGGGFVENAAALYENGRSIWTAMAPEGTRSKVAAIKSGYYYLARKANVPIMCVGLDFAKKTLVITRPRALKPSFEEDAKVLVSFSRTIQGKRPQQAIE